MPALKWRCCFAGTKPGLLFPKNPSGVGGRHLRSARQGNRLEPSGSNGSIGVRCGARSNCFHCAWSHTRSRHGLGAVAWEGQFDRCGSRREAPPPMGRDAAAVRPSSSRYEHRVRITALLFILAPINQTFFSWRQTNRMKLEPTRHYQESIRDCSRKVTHVLRYSASKHESTSETSETLSNGSVSILHQLWQKLESKKKIRILILFFFDFIIFSLLISCDHSLRQFNSRRQRISRNNILIEILMWLNLWM